MSMILSILKALWPFITEMILAKRIKGYFTSRPLMAYSSFGGLIAFGAFMYMAFQATTCNTYQDINGATIKQLTSELQNANRDNSTLQLSLKTVLYELSSEHARR